MELKGGISIEQNQNIKTVEKAFLILEEIADGPKTFTELISLMKSNKATIHRFLTTLEKLGYIAKNHQDKYQLSAKIHSLGARGIDQLNLLEIARPFLIQLANEVNESVVIAGYTNDKVFYLDKIESPSSLRIVVEAGKSAPLYTVASGKLYLAHLNEKELELYFQKHPLKSITQSTITNVDQIRLELAEIKTKGYAVDHEEWEEFLRGVAFPIYDHSNQLISALCIAGVSYRFTNEKVNSIVTRASEIAAEISSLLRYEKKGRDYFYEKK